ncbi:ATP-grasp domain-containing protein [Tenacibaculum sp. Ill]|uniref:ATP-grasp domain-containing protein n=1 Tax=Tenacibaculum sp. Ill TaxID=3445935 RepID=UPI003F78FEBC
MKLGILTDFYNEYKLYEKSCVELGIDYVIIDFLSSKWLENIKNNLECDGFLVRPSHDFQEHNDVYMERLFFLNKVLNKKIYPSYNELKLYENKRNMASWLQINDIKHPETRVFLSKKEALSFVFGTEFPIVFKSNTGAGASGVEIVKSRREAKKIIKNIFGRFNPLLTLGNPKIKRKFNIKVPLYGDAQKHVVLIQKFYPIKWEWRIIKIGNSYFGHQKLLNGEFASGSGKVAWEKPPEDLLKLVKSICDKGNFNSMAVDIFETIEGEYMVNELQSIFGSYLDYQMKIGEKKGRYKYINDEFIFEEGVFNQYGSNLLRVSHFVEILKE